MNEIRPYRFTTAEQGSAANLQAFALRMVTKPSGLWILSFRTPAEPRG